MTQTTTYLRHPHLSGSTLAFVADDDVWLTDLPGFAATARAWRVTSDRVPVKRPLLSPDGSRLAWTSAREGVVEAFALPVDGGPTNRLTYWGHPRTEAIGWASPDEVIVRGWGGHGHRFYNFAHSVPFEGGEPARLPYGSLKSLAVAEPGVAGSPVVLSRFYAGNSWLWKGYRGGAAGQLWIDREGGGEFERFLADLDGNLGDPMWFDGRVVFHSDHEDNVAELYSALPDGTDLRRHTTGEGGYYLRSASTDGVRIVFQRAGRLWVMEDLEDDPRPLDIKLPGARTATTRRPIDAAKHLGVFSPDHTGRASAVEVRGTVHWLTHKDGPARGIGVEPGTRHRLPVVLGETGQTVWIVDTEGQYSFEIAAVDGSARRRILTGEFGYVLELVAAPDGKHLAATTRDNKLLLIDVEAGTLRVVADGEGKFRAMQRWGVNFASDPAFSPDSKWLAWSQRSEVPDSWQIRVADVASLETSDITEPRFRDWNPVFTADGKHLAFLSARTFDTVEEDMFFDFSFLPAVRPYLVPLAETEPSPFDPELGGRPVDSGDKDDDKEKKDSDIPATVIDAFGITTRAVPFPVASGTYADLAAVKGGVTWLAKPLTGALGTQLAGSGQDEPRPSLVRFDFGKREEQTLVGELDGYAVSGDGTRLVVADHGTLTTRPADKDDDDAKPETVDLSRIRLTVVPGAERRQAFAEAWRLQVENYIKPAMDGIDWDAAGGRYAPLVDACATDDDFVDLLWELQGELRTSHAYVDAPKRSHDDARQQGLLGADLAPDPDGTWRIVRILPGDSSVPAARSPLLAPGVAARVGDAITAVDGVPVPARVGPAALLAGKAGQPTELALRNAAGTTRAVVVVPIADEVQLRYRAWVADRRAYVLEKSGGRLGYVHLPDQAEPGWAEFHRDLGAQVVKDGLVVDTRGNRGGMTSALVVEKLTRKAIAWEYARGEQPATYPPDAPLGPLVSVCDEEAGSDGDIINQALKDHGVTVVGARTWGGVIGMDDCFYLVDGTFVSQPRYAFAFDSVGLYGLENHGCEPTVPVAMAPQDFVAERDPQLDKAIEIALDGLAKEPPAAAKSVLGVYER
ncbi:S41 family peptidase [Catenulispora pinisilvae]|uniref:S41 family peptidase n=1 Tax=Catenulispora pinisilvae TaxID=2705253 RepID=UPI0018927449|nr:S41 family peptidase [Catenulispora pinisilvae]